LKNIPKKLAESKKMCNFAIPKSGRHAPNQLSINELGTKEDNFKTLQQCYSLKELNSEGNRKTA
jgi:capsid portal protein